MELPVIQPGRRREGQPPVFAKIGIVGLGLIGGSIALAAREIWPSSLVIGVDCKDVLETAMRLHAIDVAADDLMVLAEADVVILAAPVRAQREHTVAGLHRRRSAGGALRRWLGPAQALALAPLNQRRDHRRIACV